MTLIARKSASDDFELAPAGTAQGVCVDVVDLGHHPNPFSPGKTQHKVLVIWQVDAVSRKGERLTVQKRYTLSLDDRAILRHDLESWRGRSFTKEEEAGFDVQQVIGANALLNIQHATSSQTQRTYANVVSVTPLMRGMMKLHPEGYTRPEWVSKLMAESPSEPTDEQPVDRDVEDDEIPFAWMIGMVGTAMMLSSAAPILL